MAGLVLVRYGELALKSPPVRREFEAALRRNIVQMFVEESRELRLRSDRGHLYAEVGDAEEGARILRRVFGVTSVSVVHEVPTERGPIREKLLELSGPRLPAGASFAVRARRTGSHPFTSQELGRDLGSDVYTAFADRRLRVDLTHPDVELFVEVRGPRTYLYFDRYSGPGGLPLGVAGRLAALVDGERGALGAYLMMKRGCRVALACPPAGLPFARSVLRRFDPKAVVTELSGERSAWEGPLRATAEAVRAEGVVLPLLVDDYAAAREGWGTTVLFSPTVGLRDDEVHSRWQAVLDLSGDSGAARADGTPGGAPNSPG